MPSALHHSFALEVMSLTYGHDRTDTTSWDAAPHLVGCAGRKHFALHSYAFTKCIEVICLCCYEAMSYGYVQDYKEIYVKLLFNSTCGLNNLSKQVRLLRCFHLTLALLNPGTRCLRGREGDQLHVPHIFIQRLHALININLACSLDLRVKVKLWLLNLFLLEFLIIGVGCSLMLVGCS